MVGKNRIHFLLGLTALLLVASLVLSVGVAFGRYRTKIEDLVYLFTPKVEPQIYLWGVDERGNIAELPGSWTLEQNGSSLEFVVTNGASNQYASYDLGFVVQVAVTSDVSNGGSLNLALTPEGEITGITATVMAIQSGTKLYEEFGPGWLYRFVDSNGEEYRWTLSGGRVSEFQAELFCEGTVTEDTSGMMQMQVIAAG